jgi:hypothetical protein
MGRFVGLRMRNGLAVSIGRGVFIAAHEFLERRYAWRMPKSENPLVNVLVPGRGEKSSYELGHPTPVAPDGACGKAKANLEFSVSVRWVDLFGC